MSNYDFNKYKQSKILIEHLKAIIKVCDLSLRGLEHFKLYTPVQVMIHTISEQKRILEIHYEKQKEIRRNKGKVNGS